MALLQLCLCVATLIHLTSSQSTYDVIQQENDISTCRDTEQVLNELVRAVSRMETRMETSISQLQRDVAELKAFNQQAVVAGRPVPQFAWKSNTSLSV